MEAATHPAPHALPPAKPQPAPEAWDWVYDDPDLAPYRASARQGRKETPLTAWA